MKYFILICIIALPYWSCTARRNSDADYAVPNNYDPALEETTIIVIDTITTHHDSIDRHSTGKERPD